MLMEVYRSASGQTTYYAGPIHDSSDPVEKYVILTRTYDEKGQDVWKMAVVDYGEFADKLEHSRLLQTFIDCH